MDYEHDHSNIIDLYTYSNENSNDNLKFESKFDTIAEYAKDYMTNASKYSHSYMSRACVLRYGNTKNMSDVENIINKNSLSLKEVKTYTINITCMEQ